MEIELWAGEALSFDVGMNSQVGTFSQWLNGGLCANLSHRFFSIGEDVVSMPSGLQHSTSLSA